ncbi:MAG: hypothetical protein AAF236_02140 [Verrucomicrobiota bacterium]
MENETRQVAPVLSDYQGVVPPGRSDYPHDSEFAVDQSLRVGDAGRRTVGVIMNRKRAANRERIGKSHRITIASSFPENSSSFVYNEEVFDRAVSVPVLEITESFRNHRGNGDLKFTGFRVANLTVVQKVALYSLEYILGYSDRDMVPPGDLGMMKFAWHDGFKKGPRPRRERGNRRSDRMDQTIYSFFNEAASNNLLMKIDAEDERGYPSLATNASPLSEMPGLI